MKKRVVVAMSGGVDSSVAAAILKQKGSEVVGMTMCFNIAGSPGKKPSCCGIQGIEDAQRVAHKLGIKHYVVNLQRAFEENVIKDFCREYSRGHTPNPCIRCNQFIKFDALFKRALSLDADFLATGHYALIRKVKGLYYLKKAKDASKDQSYFLYRLSQGQLRHIIFPIGEYTKSRIRDLARKSGLSVAGKKDSQEICFLPHNNYRDFLKGRLKQGTEPGFIVDTGGRVLGRHAGVAFYTIGQRQGLGIAKGYPVYISEIDSKNNRIVVATKEEVLKKDFLLKETHFITAEPKNKVVLAVKIRYNHTESSAEITREGNFFRVIFRQPQFAITPGQSAVFYDRDTVIGGGIIDKVIG